MEAKCHEATFGPPGDGCTSCSRPHFLAACRLLWQPARPCSGAPQGPFGWSLGCCYQNFGPFVLNITYVKSFYMFWTSFDTPKPSPNIGTSTNSNYLVSGRQGLSFLFWISNFPIEFNTLKVWKHHLNHYSIGEALV